ncbi:helix-turn-helix domain-containing protein [Chryseobacterium koreense]|uniref:Helix-turn-helix domain-containing protein n=1 Tax=Chryseobacterium koreense CCUG 49689 TaxID=1304281 RepID=A0A0J7LLY5_9FLAO|nr:helix-turn-helix domain-containing protein [Chryseobacterium koreense]KMQ70075.1 hypothetical protein ACM44_14240 [Chryseobacterium koreense CCUG 49689]MBB5333696.1 hypothetical protein [Chryseobacterium koreense]
MSQLPVELQKQLNELKKLLKDNFINDKEVLSSSEAIAYLGISYSLLSKLTSSRSIPFYKPTNGLLFFLKSDLVDWVKDNKVYNQEDAEIFLKNNKKK